MVFSMEKGPKDRPEYPVMIGKKNTSFFVVILPPNFEKSSDRRAERASPFHYCPFETDFMLDVRLHPSCWNYCRLVGLKPRGPSRQDTENSGWTVCEDYRVNSSSSRTSLPISKGISTVSHSIHLYMTPGMVVSSSYFCAVPKSHGARWIFRSFSWILQSNRWETINLSVR